MGSSTAAVVVLSKEIATSSLKKALSFPKKTVPSKKVSMSFENVEACSQARQEYLGGEMWNFCSGRPSQRGRVSLTGRRRRLPASGIGPLRLIGGGLGEGASWANSHGRSQGKMVVRLSFSRLVVGELEERERSLQEGISQGGPFGMDSLAGSAFLRSYSEPCAKAARPRGCDDVIRA